MAQLSIKLDTTRMGRDGETECSKTRARDFAGAAGSRLPEVATVLLPDIAIARTLQIASHQLPNGTDP